MYQMAKKSAHRQHVAEGQELNTMAKKEEQGAVLVPTEKGYFPLFSLPQGGITIIANN